VSEGTGRIWLMPFMIIAGMYLILSVVDRVIPLEGSRHAMERYGDARGAVLVGVIADLRTGGNQTRGYIVPRRLFSGRAIVVRREAGSVTAYESRTPLFLTGIVVAVATLQAFRLRRAR